MLAAKIEAPRTSPARARLAELIGRRDELAKTMASQLGALERLKGMIGIEANAQAELDAFDAAAGAAMATWLQSGGAQPAAATGQRRKLVGAVDAAGGQTSAARSALVAIEADYANTATELNAIAPLIADGIAEVIAAEAAPLLEEAAELRARLASTLARLACLPPKLFELADRARPRLATEAAHHARTAEQLQGEIRAAAAPIAGPTAEAEEARRWLDDLCTRLAADATAGGA